MILFFKCGKNGTTRNYGPPFLFPLPKAYFMWVINYNLYYFIVNITH